MPSVKIGDKIAKPLKPFVDHAIFIDAILTTRYKKLIHNKKISKIETVVKKFKTKNQYDVCYILEDTGFWGGVKGTFVQANGLKDLGYHVLVISKTGHPNWFKLKCDFLQLTENELHNIPSSDIYIGTWYKTLKYIKIKILSFYCRGYEGNFEYFNKQEIQEIEEVYNYNNQDSKLKICSEFFKQ